MAAFKQHVTVSTILGAGYSLALTKMGVGGTQAVTAGALCAVSGMLPDLDSPSGKPIQLVFGLGAIAAALLAPRRLQSSELTPEKMVLAIAAIYLGVRFGAAWLFKRLTVHRGMFHSIPAALIATEIAFLIQAPPYLGQWKAAGGVLLGFLSHLVLDEIYSVDMSGMRVRLKGSAGSAVKLFSQSLAATSFTWLLLGLLTYLAGVQQGYLSPIYFSPHRTASMHR
jgi:membrane-bound metal-dependent hydrolase YbcI (DUF457 family)